MGFWLPSFLQGIGDMVFPHLLFTVCKKKEEKKPDKVN